MIYTINGIPFALDETKKYYDFFISFGKPVLAEVTFTALFQAMASGEVDIQTYRDDMVLLDRWIREAPRKRMWRKRKLAGEMEIVHDGIVISVDSGEYWFDTFPDADAEEIFVALENSGHVARRFLETFLPDVAERCKQRRHPAEATYIGPVEP